MDIDKLVDKFIYNLKIKGFSKNTIESYANDLKLFAEYFKDKGTIKDKDVKSFADNYLYNRYKPSTVNRKLSSVRNFLKFLTKHGYINVDFSILKNQKIKRIPPDYLPFKVIKESIDETRDGLIVRLMYASGLRVSEIVNLKISDIMFDSGFLRIKGKGEKDRFVPLDQETIVKIKEYIENVRNTVKGHGLNDYLFISNRGKPFTRQGLWKIIKKRFNNLGYNVHPHTLRHMFATHMIENGANIRAVQDMLGHESITTTQVYTDISDKALEEAFHKAEIKR